MTFPGILKAADGQFHGQDDFGDRIEAAGHLITSHPAAELMEIQLVLGLFPQPYEHRVRDAWTHVTGGLAEELGVPVYASNVGK